MPPYLIYHNETLRSYSVTLILLAQYALEFTLKKIQRVDLVRWSNFFLQNHQRNCYLDRTKKNLSYSRYHFEFLRIISMETAIFYESMAFSYVIYIFGSILRYFALLGLIIIRSKELNALISHYKFQSTRNG